MLDDYPDTILCLIYILFACSCIIFLYSLFFASYLIFKYIKNRNNSNQNSNEDSYEKKLLSENLNNV